MIVLVDQLFVFLSLKVLVLIDCFRLKVDQYLLQGHQVVMKAFEKYLLLVCGHRAFVDYQANFTC